MYYVDVDTFVQVPQEGGQVPEGGPAPGPASPGPPLQHPLHGSGNVCQ